MVAAFLLHASFDSAVAPASPIKAHEAPLPDVTDQVDPFIGTFGNGNVFPGADVPFGMVQWSPDTGPSGITRPGGYFYRDAHITGFPVTHLSGAGCVVFDDVPIMPTLKPITVSPAAAGYPYSDRFAHDQEQASPGYYAVRLGSGIEVQLSVTARSGLGRFTFPRGRARGTAELQPRVLFDTGGSAGPTSNHDQARDAGVRVLDATEVAGWATSGRFCGLHNRYTVYFAARFDRPFTSWGTWLGTGLSRGARSARGPRSGAWVTFPAAAHTVRLKIGVSFVSERNALLNLQREDPSWSVEAVRRQARALWNRTLNLIQVGGGPPQQEQSFYTALYHAMLHPNVFSDVNGQYPGFDGRVHVAPGRAQYANFSGWDIYRTQIPLLAWLQPRVTSDIMQSLVADSRQLGWLPKWPVANDESQEMNGDSSAPILASAYAFGARWFDARAALRSMEHGASQPGIAPGAYVERPGLQDYLRLGYVPPQTHGYGAAATTLEYAVDDFAIARLAGLLGDGATRAASMRRAQAWQYVLNPATGFVEPAFSNGAFSPGFDPTSEEGFVEGNAWTYTWWVPYNLSALFQGLGGESAVVGRLNQFFTRFADNPDTRFAWLGNEPSLEIPWEYDFTSQPWRAQALLHRIVTALYPRAAYGLPGNDDLGTMSAWLVWADLGLYPEIPGVGGLVLSSPLFPRIVVHLPNGHIVRVDAPGAGSSDPYIHGMTLRGHPSTRTFVPLPALAPGGEIRFQLGRTPDRLWGSRPADRPPSFAEGESPALGFVDRPAIRVVPGGSATLRLGARSVTGAGTTVRWRIGADSVFPVPARGVFRSAPGSTGRQTVILRASPSAAPGVYTLTVSFDAETRGTAGQTAWVPMPRRAVQVIVP